MHRPGLMAPPDLHELPPQPGLMSPGSAEGEPVDVRVALWTVAGVLAAIELSLQLAV